MNVQKMRRQLLRGVPDHIELRISRWDLDADPTLGERKMTEWMRMVSEKYNNSPNFRFDIYTDFLIDYNQQLFIGRVRFVPGGIEVGADGRR